MQDNGGGTRGLIGAGAQGIAKQVNALAEKWNRLRQPQPAM